MLDIFSSANTATFIWLSSQQTYISRNVKLEKLKEAFDMTLSCLLFPTYFTLLHIHTCINYSLYIFISFHYVLVNKAVSR